MTNHTITLALDFELSAKLKALLAYLQAQDSGPSVLRVTPTSEPAKEAVTPPTPGAIWPGQGGHYICTLPALLDMPARHLVFASRDADDTLPYGPYTEITGTTSQVNGRANTSALICAGKDHKAANWAKGYSEDGHTDYFLPARLDLLMAYICAPQIFKKSLYWTSTQDGRICAFVQSFEYGLSHWTIKDLELRVRACRVIPLHPLSA